jgi:hypothetical protein
MISDLVSFKDRVAYQLRLGNDPESALKDLKYWVSRYDSKGLSRESIAYVRSLDGFSGTRYNSFTHDFRGFKQLDNVAFQFISDQGQWIVAIMVKDLRLKPQMAAVFANHMEDYLPETVKEHGPGRVWNEDGQLQLVMPIDAQPSTNWTQVFSVKLRGSTDTQILRLKKLEQEFSLLRVTETD